MPLEGNTFPVYKQMMTLVDTFKVFPDSAR